jgi:hypothetical protein
VLLHTLSRKDRVLVFGGETEACGQNPCVGNDVISRKVWEFEPGSPSAPGGALVSGTWRAKADMRAERSVLNAVVLPTGQILVVGGHDSCDTPILTPELYDPDASAQQPGASTMLTASGGLPRNYHATTVLMPDGRVLVAGGEDAAGFPASRYNLQLFSPRYVSNPPFPRPQISGASATQMALNVEGSAAQTFTVDVTMQADHVVDRVVLLRPGAVTHHFDGDQRYIELAHVDQTLVGTARTLLVTCPEENLAPPGWYTLWVVEKDLAAGTRVPSQSMFVRFQ